MRLSEEEYQALIKGRPIKEVKPAQEYKEPTSLILPYPPTLNKLYATFNGRRMLSKNGKAFKANVLSLCMLKRIKPLEGNIAITFTAYRPRKIGDLDNLNKIIFDSLKGSAFYDDKQIVEMHTYRRDDKDNPRVEIEIRNV